MQNSCPTKEGKWAISCIALIRCQARRLQQLLLQYYCNPDETTTKFSTLKKTQLLRSQNVFKLHNIARKLARIYWTSNFQMTQKNPTTTSHHIYPWLRSNHRLADACICRGPQQYNIERGEREKGKTDDNDQWSQKRKKGGKKKKKKK
jgi:hypothetical protein